MWKHIFETTHKDCADCRRGYLPDGTWKNGILPFCLGGRRMMLPDDHEDSLSEAPVPDGFSVCSGTSVPELDAHDGFDGESSIFNREAGDFDQDDLETRIAPEQAKPLPPVKLREDSRAARFDRKYAHAPALFEDLVFFASHSCLLHEDCPRTCEWRAFANKDSRDDSFVNEGEEEAAVPDSFSVSSRTSETTSISDVICEQKGQVEGEHSERNYERRISDGDATIESIRPSTEELNITTDLLRKEFARLLPLYGNDLFKYRPLERPDRMIRLIRLGPRAQYRFEHISCEMRDFHLDQLPEYGALSYCWGSDANMTRLMCNGKVFHARQSLEKALRQVRGNFDLKDREEWVWADALCIDQSNAYEKDSQIPLMRIIYSGAKTVYVSLGDRDKDTWARWAPRPPRQAPFLTYISARNAGIQDQTLVDVVSSKRKLHYLKAVFAMSSPWFIRTWTVQELVLSRRTKLLYAGNVIDRSEFDACISEEALELDRERVQQLHSHRSLRIGFMSYMQTRELQRSWNRKARDTLLFAILAGRFEASVAKDKVFGMMGLMPEVYEKTIGSYSTSDEDTFLAFAMLQIIEQRGVALLERAGLHRRRMILEPPRWLPSWVPDWTAQNTSPTPVSETSQVPFSAGGDLADICQPYKGNYGGCVQAVAEAISTVISITGLQVDLIRSVTPFGNAEDSPEQFAASHLRIWDVFNDFVDYTKDDDRYRDVVPEEFLVKVFLMDNTYTGKIDDMGGRPILEPVSTYRRLLHTWTCGKRSGFEKVDIQGRRSPLETFEIVHTRACFGRYFAVTGEGRIAWVPTISQIGDIVIAVPGSPVPFVLRLDKVSPEGTCVWKLIGDAYVHGIMHGEAIKGRSSELTSFWLA